MFKFEEICELVRLVGSTRVGGVEIEHGGSRLRIEGMLPVQAPVPALGPQPPAESAAAEAALSQSPPPEEAASSADSAAEDGCYTVTSPIVGTFYTAPSPDAPPFVDVGSRVRQGQVLCIVEAMKVMNEIESEIDAEVLDVLVADGQPVEYGETLFFLRPLN